jgi:hypothetical protein
VSALAGGLAHVGAQATAVVERAVPRTIPRSSRAISCRTSEALGSDARHVRGSALLLRGRSTQVTRGEAAQRANQRRMIRRAGSLQSMPAYPGGTQRSQPRLSKFARTAGLRWCDPTIGRCGRSGPNSLRGGAPRVLCFFLDRSHLE